jgi:hypothetical protein
MPYEVNTVKKYPHPLKKVYESAYLSIGAMGGKVVLHEVAKGRLQGQMDKKLYGKILGDRSLLDITLTEADGETQMAILAYPLNAINQKLMFGARPGVVQTVLAAFHQEVEKRLAQAENKS